MLNIDEWTITNAVLEAQVGCTDTRLQTVMTSLVRHLHDFAREVAQVPHQRAQHGLEPRVVAAAEPLHESRRDRVFIDVYHQICLQPLWDMRKQLFL